MQYWYVARTKPRSEFTTAAMLAQRGVEVFLPAVPPRRRADRPSRREALFPGYLFARLDLASDAWLIARSAPGVAYFLGADGAPTPLPDDLIETIQLRLERQATRRREAPFRPGELVVITDGPFTGLEAVFDGCLSARGRVRVLLEIVERQVPVAVDVHHLAKAKETTDSLPTAI